MPKTWAGRWLGGRFYLDPRGLKVFVIERRGRAVRLQTHDENIANGQLGLFLQDPAAFCRPPPEPQGPLAPVYITKERLTLYMESIRATCEDHQKARRSYLHAWASLNLDLRAVDRRSLRLALAEFKGGHRGRVEALNAFCNFLVEEEELPAWRRFINTKDPKPTRAERQAYTLEELRAAYDAITEQPIKDLFYLRVATGMHQTEIDQLAGARVTRGLLPERGTGIRVLEGEHEIQGVLQVMHKSTKRHRQPVDAPALRAALRLREGVPHRMHVWEVLAPLVPSNLRHTFATLSSDCGRQVTLSGAGISRADVARSMGHRRGSTMLADRYEQVQVPPMTVLPLKDWDVL